MTLPPPITSRTNERVKMLRAAFAGKSSQPGEMLGIEGELMLAEAAASGMAFEAVFVRHGSEASLQRPQLANIMAREFVTLSADAFDSAVDTTSPQGVAAVLTIPELQINEAALCGVTLVLESVQDPGNLGTLLRSAQAFGVKQVLVTGNTVSAWNQKTVRASAGSVFRVPVVKMPLEEIGRVLHAASARILAAVVKMDGATALHETQISGACALLIGNEGMGLSQAALAIADELVHIPCEVESLNAAVAGSTLMYEAMRQRLAAAGKQIG